MGDSYSQESSHPPARASYDSAYFAPLARIEDRHFWFRSRNRVIEGLIRRIESELRPGYRVLEVGCGTGNVLRVLRRVCTRGMTLGMDLFAGGMRFARQRTDAELIRGDVHAPPFGAHFDLIGLFDVLEHLPDDVEVLGALRVLLTPGGRLVLTVPAHPSLWSYFDEASRHARRYDESDLIRKLTGAGFEIEYWSYYMMILFPLLWAGRRWASLNNRRSPGEGRIRELANAELRIIPGINELLTLVLTLELQIIGRRRQLPMGTSLLVIARNGPSAVSSPR